MCENKVQGMSLMDELASIGTTSGVSAMDSPLDDLVASSSLSENYRSLCAEEHMLNFPTQSEDITIDIKMIKDMYQTRPSDENQDKMPQEHTAIFGKVVLNLEHELEQAISPISLSVENGVHQNEKKDYGLTLSENSWNLELELQQAMAPVSDIFVSESQPAEAATISKLEVLNHEEMLAQAFSPEPDNHGNLELSEFDCNSSQNVESKPPFVVPNICIEIANEMPSEGNSTAVKNEDTAKSPVEGPATSPIEGPATSPFDGQVATDAVEEKFQTPMEQEQANSVAIKKKLEMVEWQLHEEQNLTAQAAKMGMKVLDENRDLKEKVDILKRKVVVAEEEFKMEKHANRLKLETKNYMEQQYNEEIVQLKEEVAQLNKDLEVAQKMEASVSRQLRSSEYSLEQSNLKEQQLTTTIEHLEKLIQEKAEQAVHDMSKSFSDGDSTEQYLALQHEVVDLKNECTSLKSQLISHDAKATRMEEELGRAKRRLYSKEQEYEEIVSEINSYQKTLEISQVEILDLKAQLHAAQIETVSRQDRGNSLFSEVEDRRVSAEIMVRNMQARYQSLKEQYDAEKHQHHKLKCQTVALLQMNSGKVSETYVQHLNSMLEQAQNEVKELQDKVRGFEKSVSQQNDKMIEIQKAFGTKENQDFIDFLKCLNDRKQKDLETSQEKLNHLEMQYIQETNKVVDYIKKLRVAENEAQCLRCCNMKLKLQVEELMMKYMPDQVSEETGKKRHIEKIPLGPTENLPDMLKSAKERRKTIAKVPVPDDKQTAKPMNQKIAEMVRCGSINPVDLLKDSPKSKKKMVSVAPEVTLIDHDGKEEHKPSKTSETILLPMAKKPPGKVVPTHKIIEVKPPVHGSECKQQ